MAALCTRSPNLKRSLDNEDDMLMGDEEIDVVYTNDFKRTRRFDFERIEQSNSHVKFGTNNIGADVNLSTSNHEVLYSHENQIPVVKNQNQLYGITKLRQVDKRSRTSESNFHSDQRNETKTEINRQVNPSYTECIYEDHNLANNR